MVRTYQAIREYNVDGVEESALDIARAFKGKLSGSGYRNIVNAAYLFQVSRTKDYKLTFDNQNGFRVGQVDLRRSFYSLLEKDLIVRSGFDHGATNEFSLSREAIDRPSLDPDFDKIESVAGKFISKAGNNFWWDMFQIIRLIEISNKNGIKIEDRPLTKEELAEISIWFSFGSKGIQQLRTIYTESFFQGSPIGTT